MNYERGGRGRGRNSGGGRFGGRGHNTRGLTPSVGAYLDYAPGREANISYTTLWSKKVHGNNKHLKLEFQVFALRPHTCRLNILDTRDTVWRTSPLLYNTVLFYNIYC